jgi:sulfide:quinone oxidoreductase
VRELDPDEESNQRLPDTTSSIRSTRQEGLDMARTVILGAGISGHTAALRLKRALGRRSTHEVIVVSPNADWNWIPSNIWVGVGRMSSDKVLFPLAPVYRRQGITFHQAKATAIHPHGAGDDASPFVEIEYTDPRDGTTERIHYDYLVNATGPKLNFAATPGLGPDGNSVSVCTASHAVEAAEQFEQLIAKVRETGERQRVVVGVGHGTCTCEGAAFEYTFNVDQQLRDAGVRDQVELVYLTNEAQLGDFGVDGMVFEQEGFETTSELWTASLFRERDVKAIVGAHVERVDPGVVHYELLDGTRGSLEFDFAMLLPPFRGQDLRAIDADGSDITEEMFAPSGFMKVDAEYSPKPYEEWKASDWPRTYEAPAFTNHFAVGIAFAPPHQISRPRTSVNGTVIAPAPPRTGMPSGIMGRTAVETIADRIKGRNLPAHEASMTSMAAACVASSGAGMRTGSAAGMTMYPVVPDPDTYRTGRSIKHTRGELGLSGHWTKALLHHMFIYKAKARPLWWMIPE